jgi:transposase-like protein
MPAANPPEFRRRAIALARAGHQSIARIAADLGIGASSSPHCAASPSTAPTTPPTGRLTPTLSPGEESAVCVTVEIPLMPKCIDAKTATGQFVIDRGLYVDG